MNFSNRPRKPKPGPKKKVVAIIKQKAKNSINYQATIDYKNIVLLRKFITAEGKIIPRRINGLSAKQQRYISKAIKNARMMGFIPFINHSMPPRI